MNKTYGLYAQNHWTMKVRHYLVYLQPEEWERLKSLADKEVEGDEYEWVASIIEGGQYLAEGLLSEPIEGFVHVWA